MESAGEIRPPVSAFVLSQDFSRTPPSVLMGALLCYNAGMSFDTNILQRFWSKVDKSSGKDGCWNWLASTTEFGYGRFWDGEKVWGAHRFALYCVDPFPSESCCHSCDNPTCCNPNHLRWDTQQNNVNDMWLRNRRNKIYPFTPSMINYIRNTPKSRGVNKSLAAEFGVTVKTIENIRCRKTYKKITSDWEEPRQG